jgi:hypothetical protein
MVAWASTELAEAVTAFAGRLYIDHLDPKPAERLEDLVELAVAGLEREEARMALTIAVLRAAGLKAP